MITDLRIGEVLLYSVVGILTVIAVLAILAILITLVSRFVARFAAKPAVKEPLPGPDVLKFEETLPELPAATQGELKLRDVDDQTAAILMAIVADEAGIPLNELRFKSIKCLNP